MLNEKERESDEKAEEKGTKEGTEKESGVTKHNKTVRAGREEKHGS